jgi:hypothetical protein
MADEPYVIVRHKSTGRTFSLDRAYQVLNADLGNLDPPEKFVDDWDEWLPGYYWQVPKWVNIEDKEEFHAYWLF